MRRNGYIERSSAFGQFAIQGRRGFGLRWFIEMEISFALGASSTTSSYKRPGRPVERAVDRVAERRVDEPPEREPEQPGVVVEDVELARRAGTRSPACCISQNVWPIHSLGALSKTDSSRARVCESPEAKSVTSCPSATRPSASSATTRSIPPYASGGTGNHTGQMTATLIARDPDSLARIRVARRP